MSISAARHAAAGEKAIAVWLLVCAALVFAMVVLGGATRLTHSGLSMVDWRPLTGFLPPLSDAAWETVFTDYQSYPEYQKVNAGMSLSEFKGIFWFEYSHRLLGRLIGIAFLVPFLYFAWRKWISRPLLPKLVLMFVLGGLQGVLGWYMVKSGLVDRPDVSHLRLTAHLGAAFLIFGFILWVALGLMEAGIRTGAVARANPWLRPAALVLLAATPVVALSGGLVAGLDAGFHYNTFPLMGDSFVPEGMGTLQPWWRDMFNNRTTVQFGHRVLAETLFVLAVVYYFRVRQLAVPVRVRLALNGLAAAIAVQVALGISTLVLVVPVVLAVAHQGGALVVFGCALWVTRELSPPSA